MAGSLALAIAAGCLWTNAKFFVGQPKKRLFVTIVTMKPGRISI
jgi:hypothetical protein